MANQFETLTEKQLQEALRKQEMNEKSFWRTSPFMRKTIPLAKHGEVAYREDDRLIKTDIERRELRDVLLSAIEQFPKTKSKSRLKEAASHMLDGHTGQELADKMQVTKQRASQYEAKVIGAFQSLRSQVGKEGEEIWNDIDAFYIED